MKHKRVIICLSVVVVIAAGLAFRFQRSQGQGKPALTQQQVQQAHPVPDYEVYRMLFHHHMMLKQKAAELEKQGQDGRFLREHYRREAKLTDDEAASFDAIAADCEQQVAKQDAKAKAIIDAAFAKNGNGKLAKGAKPPEPPAELRTLWDERNAIITRAETALQAAFGSSEFARFESYVKRDVVPHVSTSPSQPRPPSMRPKRGPASQSPTSEGR